jgi:hypothetical protein
LVDLSFPYHEAGAFAVAVALPADLAVLLAGVAARQATSPTALAQARLEGRAAAAGAALAMSGAFNAATVRLLTGWQEE